MSPRILSTTSAVVSEDLDRIIDRAEGDLSEITKSRTLITGATGFVGSWLALSWLRARQTLGTKGTLIVLARRFSAENRELLNSFGGDIEIIECDVRDLGQDSLTSVDNVVHAATPVRQYVDFNSFEETISIIVDGQRSLLRAIGNHRSKRVLFTSSGAIYGDQPNEMTRIEESYVGAPNVLDPRNGYHEAKRLAEQIGVVWANDTGSDFIIARLFAFLGPALPLDRHLAAGNFLRNVASSQEIEIKSKGDSIRSYQHATDLSIWLWALLARGSSSNAYNVGSDQEVTILELAELISKVAKSESQVKRVSSDHSAPSRYVPSVSKIQTELNVSNTVPLHEAISRTLRWIRGE